MPPERPTAGLRERKKLATWQTIRSAANELFDRDGFDAVGIDQIVAAANVSRSTFFNYFPTKEAVVFDVAPATVERWREILAARPAEEPLWEALQAVLLEYVGTFADYMVRVHRLKISSPALMASSRDHSDRFWGELGAWAARREPTAEPLSMALTLATVQTVFNTAFAHWEPDAGIERCLELLRRGFAQAGAGFAAPGRTP
ncbi:MAG TPA: TetR family transcriptional regulator [Conexibacter sp.]|nr:TetR family transcriptional regulator [Conexibacter sp.]